MLSKAPCTVIEGLTAFQALASLLMPVARHTTGRSDVQSRGPSPLWISGQVADGDHTPALLPRSHHLGLPRIVGANWPDDKGKRLKKALRHGTAKAVENGVRFTLSEFEQDRQATGGVG